MTVSGVKHLIFICDLIPPKDSVISFKYLISKMMAWYFFTLANEF